MRLSKPILAFIATTLAGQSTVAFADLWVLRDTDLNSFSSNPTTCTYNRAGRNGEVLAILNSESKALVIRTAVRKLEFDKPALVIMEYSSRLRVNEKRSYLFRSMGYSVRFESFVDGRMTKDGYPERGTIYLSKGKTHFSVPLTGFCDVETEPR
jgi:hypothetical protein